MGSHGNEIKRLSDDSVRRIVAEQAITDLASIVKELVDNALDAESTMIKSTLSSMHRFFHPFPFTIRSHNLSQSSPLRTGTGYSGSLR